MPKEKKQQGKDLKALHHRMEDMHVDAMIKTIEARKPNGRQKKADGKEGQ